MKVVERVSQGVVSHRDRLFSQRPFFVDTGLRARLTLKNILPGKQWSITGIALLPLAAVGIPIRSTLCLLLFYPPIGMSFGYEPDHADFLF